MERWEDGRSHGSGRVGRRLRLLVAAAVLALGLGVPAKVVLSASSDESPAPPLTLPSWTSDYFWSSGDGYAGWHKNVTASDDSAYGLEAGLPGDPGLWVWPTGEHRYAPGGAEWLLRAPGTTRIARAHLAFSYRPKLFAHHCLAIGLRDGDVQRDQRVWCKPPAPTTQDNYNLGLADPSGTPSAQEVYVQIVVPNCKGKSAACSKYIPAQDPQANGVMVHVSSVRMVLVDDDLPVVTPSKAFYELDGTYIDGEQSYPLRVESDDAGAGITRIDIDHSGWSGPQPPLAAHASACDLHHHTAELDARVCPKSDAIDLVVDTRPMPEGTRRFRAYAPDPAGNVGEKRWTVIIDRTPPTPPQNLHFTTPEEGSAQAAWDAATDPVLPDGTPGSGVRQYQSRYRVNGGSWSDWETMGRAARLNDEVYDKPAGTHVDFEVRAIDAVGNIGEAASVGGEVFGTAPHVSTSGRLVDLNGGYVGSEQSSVTVSADDTGTLASGARRLWLERYGAGEAGSVDAGCTNRSLPDGRPWKAQCPLTASGAIGIDTGALPEGANSFVAHAVDRAGNESTGGPFQILVDHSAPSAVDGATAEFDSDTGEVDIDWNDVVDPALADGHLGSGLDHYEYRVQRDGGAWSEWFTTRGSGVTLADSHDGEQLTLDVRALDAVGNASAAWEGRLVAVGPDQDISTTTDAPPAGAEVVDDLGQSEADYEGENNDFPPGFPAPEAQSGRIASAGVSVIPPSRVRATVASAPLPPPTACGRDKYQINPNDTFRVKFGRRDVTRAGDPYYQYHIHYQVRLAWRADVAWTWLAAQRTLPNGRFDPSPYDDSRTRATRDPIYQKPYYAHFLRQKVKPGSLITYWGRWQFTAPVPLPGNRQWIGNHYFGWCYARLNG